MSMKLATEVEEMANKHAEVTAEAVAVDATGDATRVTLELTREEDNAGAKDGGEESTADTLQTSDFAESEDSFDAKAALANLRDARDGDDADDAPAKAESEPADSDVCGAETADGSPCQFTPGSKCPHHRSAAAANDEGSDGEKSPEGDGPSTPLEYALANGPCVAAADADGREPCGYGAKGGETPFCGRHNGFSDPTLHEGALEAYEAWEAGDDAAVRTLLGE